MSDRRRPRRVAQLVLQEISAILFRESKDPRVKDAVLTDVEMPPDLRLAKVYFVCPEEVREQVEAGLAQASGFIRRELGKRIRLRFLPELEFIYDSSGDQGRRIEELLRHINETV